MTTPDLPAEIPTPTAPDGRPFAEFRDHGLLWLVNRVVFHPRGYALGLAYDNGQATGWEMYGDGTEPWRYADEVDEDDAFRRVDAFLASLNQPTDGAIQ